VIKQELQKLDKKTLVEHVFESLHLIALHYGIWFRETEHQLGLDKAIEADDIAWKRVLQELVELLTDMGKNWLASDGIWFQAVEQNFDYEMYNAKRINDTCWFRFSYIEAKRIMKRLALPGKGGIPALKQALGYRQYALINKQEIIDVSENIIIFRMNECRVQLARGRADLLDYPCKSGGIVEYARFAEGIDPRIKTTCIGCPPDPHPKEWYCAWEFELVT
jgi:hypothetical protein